MAGRPMLRRLNADIRDAGGDDIIFDRIADGESVKQIADDFGVSRNFMYQWRNKGPHAERRIRKWEDAMRLKAEAMEDKAEEVLGTIVPATAAEARWRNDKSNFYRWQAEVLDRPRYGDKPAALNFNLNVGDLHLNALRQRGAMPQAQEAHAQIMEGEVELLSDST